MRRFTIPILACVVAASLVACDGKAPAPGAAPTSSHAAPVSPVPVASPVASPTPPALPAVPPATSGPPTGTCVNGWATPASGTPPFTDPLGIIRRTTGVKGPLVVVDMRRFVGPESPPSPQGYLQAVERWYIKLYAQDDIAFQGRFLVESRTFGRGLAAVAPYDTNGFRSPDWVGFQYDSSDTGAKALSGASWTMVGDAHTTSCAGVRGSRFRGYLTKSVGVWPAHSRYRRRAVGMGIYQSSGRTRNPLGVVSVVMGVVGAAASVILWAYQYDPSGPLVRSVASRLGPGLASGDALVLRSPRSSGRSP